MSKSKATNRKSGAAVRSSELVSRWRRMARTEQEHAHRWATGDNWKLGKDKASAAVCETRAQILEMCANALEAANEKLSRPAAE